MRTAKRRVHNNHDLTEDWLKIKSAFSDTATDVRDKAGEMIYQTVDGIQSKSSRAQKNIATYAAKKPFKSMGIAMLAGMAIGLWLRR